MSEEQFEMVKVDAHYRYNESTGTLIIEKLNAGFIIRRKEVKSWEHAAVLT